MKGFKIAGVFAACGFLLSFVSGFFSHTSFISILLKALIFCLIFGILGFLIEFVFSKFLIDENTGDFSASIGSTNENSSNVKSTGQLVDITIEDEELERGGSENHFIVNENHQMLNDSDITKKADNTENNPGEVSNDQPGFVPLKKFETVQNISSKEAVNPDSVIYRSEESDVKKDDGIDTLPDMNNFTTEDNGTSGSVDSETESEFVSSGSRKNSDEPAEIKDAALMAKAISSILSDEES